jgi:hypothetical protein
MPLCFWKTSGKLWFVFWNYCTIHYHLICKSVITLLSEPRKLHLPEMLVFCSCPVQISFGTQDYRHWNFLWLSSHPHLNTGSPPQSRLQSSLHIISTNYSGIILPFHDIPKVSLLGYYAVFIGDLFLMMQRSLLAPSSGWLPNILQLLWRYRQQALPKCQ